MQRIANPSPGNSGARVQVPVSPPQRCVSKNLTTVPDGVCSAFVRFECKLNL